jgi:two-component sensor histidine kinase
MFSFENKQLTRIVILVFAFIIIGGTLLYTNYISRQLGFKERRAVEMWDQSIRAYGSADDTIKAMESYEELAINIIQDTTARIPIIQVDEKGKPISDRNLRGNPTEVQKKAMLKNMDSILIEYAPNRFSRVYYGDSWMLQQLRWFPYIQILVATIFVAIILVGFNIAKRNEQNRIWAGLAKETAHQLGTPVSSLMAWIDFLKDRFEDDEEDREMVEEMERDVIRLQNIAERFSKIGSTPELKDMDLSELLDKAANYMRKRMSTTINLTVNNELSGDTTISINPQLFEWVIENLLKNALDAMEGKKGSITIHITAIGNTYCIDISDTGKGISKNSFRKVFEPGFTTKKRGWGLGLSLSKRIIELYHKGKIFVKESEVGKGTTFRITLPKN